MSAPQKIKGSFQLLFGDISIVLPIVLANIAAAAPGRQFGLVAHALASCCKLSAILGGRTSQGKGPHGYCSLTKSQGLGSFSASDLEFIASSIWNLTLSSPSI